MSHSDLRVVALGDTRPVYGSMTSCTTPNRFRHDAGKLGRALVELDPMRAENRGEPTWSMQPV